MAARHRTRIPIIRLLYFGIFAACGSLMLLGYNGGDGPPIRNSSPPTPGKDRGGILIKTLIIYDNIIAGLRSEAVVAGSFSHCVQDAEVVTLQ